MEYFVPVITGVMDQPRRVVVTLKLEASPDAKLRSSYRLASKFPAKLILTVPESVSAPVTAKVFPSV